MGKRGIGLTVENLTEDQIVDMVLLAGVNEFSNRKKTITDSTLHWAKFVCSVADDLNLEITRSWYKMGQYVWSDRLNMDRVFQLAGTLQTDKYPDPQDIFKLVTGKASNLYRQIQTSAETRFEMFWKRTFDLRKELYLKEAGKEFSNLYLAELDFEEALDRIIKADWSATVRLDGGSLSRKVSQLHMSLLKGRIDEDCADAVIEASSLLELMIMKYNTESVSNDSWKCNWLSRFEELVDLYKNQVWTFPASQITIETICGPSSSSVVHTMMNKMKQSREFVGSSIGPLRSSLLSEGLIPTIEELDVRLTKKREEDRAEFDNVYHAAALYLRPR